MDDACYTACKPIQQGLIYKTRSTGMDEREVFHMTKKIIALLLAVLTALTVLPAALAEDAPEGPAMTLEEMLGINPKDWPKKMYVYTENGGVLNVRREPKTGDNVIEQLKYGDEVIAEGPVVINADWMCIRSKKGNNGVGYVMTRFLVNTQPRSVSRAVS